MRIAFAVLLIIAPIGVGCSTRQASVPARYTAIDLGMLDGLPSSKATSINSVGDVVGRSFALAGIGHAFIWRHNHLIPLAQPERGGSTASAINDNGEVVGLKYAYRGESEPADWFGNRTIRPAGPTMIISVPVAINNDGQMAGWAKPGGRNAASCAVSWDHGGPMLLESLGADGSAALGIDSHGNVCGWTSIRGRKEHQPCVWSGGIPHTLPEPASVLGGDATAINSHGQVVGMVRVGRETVHACLWSGASMVDLGTLGGASSEALAINDLGQVVGWSELATKDRHAFLFDHGRLIDLNGLIDPSSNWVLRNATAINDRGQIAGSGLHNEKFPAFLLNPVAEGAPVRAAALAVHERVQSG